MPNFHTGLEKIPPTTFHSPRLISLSVLPKSTHTKPQSSIVITNTTIFVKLGVKHSPAANAWPTR